MNNGLTIPWCPHCRAHHAEPPPWCPFRNAARMSVGAGTYYEADDPASYAGGVLPASLASSSLAPLTADDVKGAQTRGILLGIGVGVAGAALYYYAARKSAR